MGVDDRFSVRAVFGRRLCGKEESYRVPLEHVPRLFDGLVDLLVVGCHSRDIGLLREKRHFEECSELCCSALRKCAYGWQCHQADDKSSGGCNNL